jgi:son of sevenless-like protein
MDAVLSVGHNQADMAQGDYNGSIEWRMSRLSVIDTQFGGAIRPTSSFLGTYEGQGEDMVDMEVAFSRQANKGQGVGDPSYDSTLQNTSSGSEPTSNGAGPNELENATTENMVSDFSDPRPEVPEDQGSPLFEEEREFITSILRPP